MEVKDINNEIEVEAYDAELQTMLENLSRLKEAVGFNEYLDSIREFMGKLRELVIMEKDMDKVKYLQAMHETLIRIMQMADFTLEVEKDEPEL